jgi:hypothetical protein
MPRRFSLFSLPLLAALLLGLPAWRAPAGLGPSKLSNGDFARAVPAYALPTARSAGAFRSGPQPYRHNSLAWALIPGHLEAQAIEQRLLTRLATARHDALARTARHFPLFPTGPPAHS